MGKAKRKGRPSQNAPGQVGLFLAPLQALQNLLEAFDNQGVIVGGIAASLLGTPRFTADLDAVFLLSNDDLPKILQLAQSFEIEPRIVDPISFARKNRVLLCRHRPTGIDLDLIMGTLPFEIEMVERSQWIDAGQIRLRLPTPEDLIIMKAVAHRPKDLLDIQTISENHPDIDKKRIQEWVTEFGIALDLPGLWNEISGYL